MALLEVNNLKKIYTTRFGGTQVEALRNVNFPWNRENTWQSWENPVREKRHC